MRGVLELTGRTAAAGCHLPQTATIGGVPTDNLPSNVRHFLNRFIRSVEQLEILLLVSARGDLAWSVAQVYDVILSSESSVVRWLEELSRAGLLVRGAETPPNFRASEDPAVAEQIAGLRHAYKTVPTRLIEAIYKRDVDAVQGFADAFKIKEPRAE
jgi:hypothetical protein